MADTSREAVISVPYEEVDDSPQEDTDPKEGLSATRVLMCAWGNRRLLTRQLLGYSRRMGRNTVHYLPHRYPDAAEIVALTCAGRGFGKTVSSGSVLVQAWEKAKLTVAYGLPPYDLDGERALVSEDVEPAAEFITLPRKKLYWKAPPGAILVGQDEAPGLIVRMINWVYTIHQITEIAAPFWDLVGSVNDAAIQSRTFAFPFGIETLLYNPPQLSRQITTEGEKAWEMQLRFTYRPTGWNKFWRGGDSAPQMIYKAGGAQYKPYPVADLSQLVVQ